MYFGFTLDFPNRDLWDTDFLDTDLDLLVRMVIYRYPK